MWMVMNMDENPPEMQVKINIQKSENSDMT